MRNLFYLFLAISLLMINSGCKKENQGGDYQTFGFDFYFANKTTGENLVGDDQAKPFSPTDVSVFVYFEGDPENKQNFSHNIGIHEDKEVGYTFKSVYDFNNRADFIIHLGNLDPDTITFIVKRAESVKAYLNSEFIDDVTDGNKSGVPLYKIEKEL